MSSRAGSRANALPNTGLCAAVLDSLQSEHGVITVVPWGQYHASEPSHVGFMYKGLKTVDFLRRILQLSGDLLSCKIATYAGMGRAD